MKKKIFNLLFSFFAIFAFDFSIFPLKTLAFPIYAQQNYENPREPNGKIVCANCHLAQKPIDLETPKSVLPDHVFETLVSVPVKKDSKQILSNGDLGNLNIGAVLILPEEFKLAPKDRLNEELKQKIKNLYITPYSNKYENILVIGPLSPSAISDDKILFPILSPDPETNKKAYYVKYPIYAGGNRGRGQIYPNGEKTNNNIVFAATTGKIFKITPNSKNVEISIQESNGNIVKQVVPQNIGINVKENQLIFQDQPLTLNPNVGGFGQSESEIVLQNPLRLIFYTGFCFLILITQTIFVLKKKQFEKVQLEEKNF